MFTVIGDMIHWDGQPVAVFRRDIGATVREEIETALDDTLSGPCPDCMSFEQELKDLESDVADKESECEQLAQQLIDAENKIEAYATILGIKP